MVVKEKTLLKIAFSCAVVGVIALFFISQTIEIGEKEINKITEANVGDVVLLKGNVDRISHSEKVDFLKLGQMNTIDVVLFKDKGTNVSLKSGDSVEVIGKIDEYNGKFEIVGERVRVIR